MGDLNILDVLLPREKAICKDNNIKLTCTYIYGCLYVRVSLYNLK